MAKSNPAPSPSHAKAKAKAKGQGNTPAKRQTKKAQLVELLSAHAPVSLDQLSSALGWQRHTTSAAMTRLKQDGHALVSNKSEAGVRVYHIAAPKLTLTQEGKDHDESKDKASAISIKGKAQ